MLLDYKREIFLRKTGNFSRLHGSSYRIALQFGLSQIIMDDFCFNSSQITLLSHFNLSFVKYSSIVFNASQRFGTLFVNFVFGSFPTLPRPCSFKDEPVPVPIWSEDKLPIMFCISEITMSFIAELMAL